MNLPSSSHLSISLTQIYFIMNFCFLLCVVYYSFEIYLLFDLLSSFQTTTTTAKKFAQLWYKFLMISNSLFFSSFFRLNNNLPKNQKKITIFSQMVTWTSFLNFNTFYVIYVFYLYISLAFCYIYIFNFMFRNFVVLFGKQKYCKML